ncbi:glycosyltransferase [Halomonas sp. DP5Y7-2]|uniref:glycosyltransferase family 2 protein n=1 Tax=Halomonas sp. DP5Y7-2 TaxID=2859076 RepID=UPI001C99C760|nr:glycosyltransferase family 2 protein [Halomonas sp. DP5Y7-2]MBY5985167.1 glycosyltransferase [Halomonas sp. DP5Y7-2]
MKFSIIIPLYNKENQVKRCIKSIAKQTYSNYAVIIVNDGSTDNSLLKAEEATKEFGISGTIIDTKNEGVSAARNRAIELAGDDTYLAFIDADDAWDPKYLENMAELIAKFPDFNIFASSYAWYKQGKVVRHKNGYKDGEIITTNYNDLSSFPFLSCNMSSVVVAKAAIFSKKLLFPTGQKMGEDLNFLFLLSIFYDMVFVNKPLSFYYIETIGNATSTHGAMDEQYGLKELKGKNTYLGKTLQAKDRSFFDYLLWFYLKSRYKCLDFRSVRESAFDFKKNGLKFLLLYMMTFFPKSCARKAMLAFDYLKQRRKLNE